MDKNKKYIPKKEFWAFSVGALGQGMVYATMSSYISDFYLNVLRVGPLFVLFLMLFARVWDAINDPLMGMIVDKAEPKKGKMLPYLIYTPIPIALLTLSLFLAPDVSNTAKMIYATVTYVLWGMIYTMSDVPFWSLPNAMTPNSNERGKILSIARTTNGIGSAIPMAIFMALGFILPAVTGLSGLELEKTKYITIALVASILGNILFARVYFKTKERVIIPRPEKRGKGEGALRLIFTCKPLMLVVAMGILASARYMFQAAAIHVARYSFYIGKDLTGLSSVETEKALQSSISLVNTVFAVATALGMFGTMLLIPKLIEKYSYKGIIVTTCIIGFASSLVMFFIGYENFWACVPFLVLSCVPCGAINAVSSAMVGDCLDYMEWKTGRRENALGNACQSFVSKLGNAISTSFIVLMYIIVNLDISKIGVAYTPNPTLMDPGIRSGMFSLVSIIPGVSLLLCCIPIFFYDLVGEKKERMLTELAKQREERGITVEQ